MSSTAAAKTPWDFKLRAFVIALAFGIGFGVGYPVQIALFHDATPTFVLLGQRFGETGILASAWACAALCVLAWLIRLWGASYHSPGVVMSADVVTDTFTAAGPYRIVRNPLYLGNCFLALGIGALGPPAATALVFGLNLWFVYRLIGIEERFLRRSVGEPYERYCAAVPRLLPRLSPADLPPDHRRPNVVYGLLTELFSAGFAAAMIAFAWKVPTGVDQRFGGIFWMVAFAGILLQMVLAPAARRAQRPRS